MPTALITGASVGIGRELAREFARDRYDLILVARDEPRLQEVARECEGISGRSARVHLKDLARPCASQELFDELQMMRASVDVLVNNAGFGLSGRFVDLDLQKQLDMIQVNVTSLVHLTHLFLPAMIGRRTGGVLNVASTAAFQPGAYMAVYYATKAFVLSFSEALSHEVRHTGLKVTALCPGPTHTEFQQRANLQAARMFASLPFLVQNAATVARTGYRAFKRGKPVVVSGILNKLQIQSVRFAPRRLVRSIAAKVNRSKH
jgi:short-subunit dehydrogenase